MAGPKQEEAPKVDMDFTINTIKNVSSNHEINDREGWELESAPPVRESQVPLVLSVKGPPSLRGRPEAYKVER